MEEWSTLTHRVRREEAGKMVRQVLRNRFRFSRRMFRRLKEARAVEVNGDTVFITSRVYEGDRIRVRLPGDEGAGVEPQPVPVHLVYEDEDIAVIDKQPGVVVHPTKHDPDHTLANGLAHHWQERGEFHLIRPVTRLDRDTSGLLVFAKHPHAHARLSAQMQQKRYRRDYVAVVHGRLHSGQGSVDQPIARSRTHPRLRTVSPEGAKALTHYRVLERFPQATLIRLRLETGRTHQIRVHMAHLGHPLLGDTMYGGKGDRIGRQALHALHLSLYHPRDGHPHSWTASLAADLKQLLEELRGDEEDSPLYKPKGQ